MFRVLRWAEEGIKGGEPRIGAQTMLLRMLPAVCSIATSSRGPQRPHLLPSNFDHSNSVMNMIRVVLLVKTYVRTNFNYQTHKQASTTE